MKKAILIALVVLVVLILVWVNASVNRIFVQPELEDMENYFNKYWPEVERDIDRLEAERMFRPSRYLRDAGERMNSSFDWKNGKGRVKEGSLLHISKETVETIKQKGDSWVALDPNDINDNIDFSWLELLTHYDYWDLNKAIIDHAGPRIFYPHMPVPEISILLIWSKLAFIWSKDEKNFVETSAKLRKLTNILYSSNNLIASLIGVRILRIEHEFKSAMLKNDLPVPNSWRTFGDEVTDAAKAVLFAKAWAANLLMNTDNIARVFPNEKILIGDCLCIHETALNALMFKQNLSQKQDKQFEIITNALEKYQYDCNTIPIKQLWEGQTEKEVVSILDAISEPTSTLEYLLKYFGKLPLFKETITKVFFVIHLPNAFIEYRKTIGRNGRANRANGDSP
jgi:hypothetical protein